MLVPLPGVGKTASYLKSKIKVTLVFEIIDDPDDSAELRAYTKAANISVRFSKTEATAALGPADFHGDPKKQHVTFVPGVTKQTVLEARKIDFVDLDSDGAYMYVLVEPSEEWKDKYESRVYGFQIKSGRVYNVAVALKPKKEPEPESKPKKKGLIL